MSHRSQAGRATGSVVLLLLILTGAGAWNYHRNWQIEKDSEGHRPYESYAVADLSALRDAYEAELVGVRARFEAAKRERVRPQRDVGSMTDNVAQFQRTARTSTAIREAAAHVADRQEQVEALDRELAIRSRFGEGLMRHVKRLTTL